MLQSVKNQVRDAQIASLLALAVFPDAEHLERAITFYEENGEAELLTYEEAGEKIGIIGFRPSGEGEITITHIAVAPNSRGAGYGRGMLLELMVREKPGVVVAETDEEAVDFYRAVGFAVVSLGFGSAGLERFRCAYEVEEEDE